MLPLVQKLFDKLSASLPALQLFDAAGVWDSPPIVANLSNALLGRFQFFQLPGISRFCKQLYADACVDFPTVS
eukprot:10595137-Karenia_brevis.AAC.1